MASGVGPGRRAQLSWHPNAVRFPFFFYLRQSHSGPQVTNEKFGLRFVWARRGPAEERMGATVGVLKLMPTFLVSLS